MSAKKRPALGKGLGALLQSADTDITSSNAETGVGAIAEIPIEDIEANPFNPRTTFEKEALKELSDSIAQHGIIQPLTVRKLGRDKYQLISGERRFRAAQLVGLEKVPAYIRIANDQTMLEMALVENIQRENLNPIEVAISYKRLIDECQLTQEQLSQKISKSRTSITNYLRLLKLPAEIQTGVLAEEITMGHARALVSVDDEKLQLELYQRIIDENLSVRDIEAILRGENIESPKTSEKEKQKNKKTEKAKLPEEFISLKESLSERLSTKVKIQKSPKGGGKIVLEFNSDEDLGRIMELLNK